MSKPAAPSHDDRRIPLWPLAISLVATVAILLISGAVTFDLRKEIGSRAQESASNLLRVIERDISRNIEMLGLSLEGLVDGVGRADVMALPSDLRDLVLFDRAATASGTGRIAAFDTSGELIAETGTVEASSVPTVLGREFFDEQRQPGRGLYISRPYYSSSLHAEMIGLSRRISDRDGAFAGVALATIRISYFADLLAKLQLGPSGIVSLVREDGAVIIRNGPDLRGKVEDLSQSATFQRIRRERAGSFTAISALDGAERTYTFTQVGPYPLYLSVGLATRDTYAEWSAKALLIGLVMGGICLIILALTAVLTRELYRRSKAEHRLVVANTRLAHLSITDPLTDLGNRRQFDLSLAREIRRARRLGNRLGLIVLDVDHFKRFNDRYGHQEGDEVLRQVGRVLRRCASRPGDAAFRVGGEEFALILPSTPMEGAARVAEMIRSEIRGMDRPHSDSDAGIVTVSIGVAAIEQDDAEDAYARADAALYDAKRAGRDRVVRAAGRLAA